MSIALTSAGSNKVTVICFVTFALTVGRISGLMASLHRLTNILRFQDGLLDLSFPSPGCGVSFLRQSLSTHGRYLLTLTESINGQYHVFVSDDEVQMFSLNVYSFI